MIMSKGGYIFYKNEMATLFKDQDMLFYQEKNSFYKTALSDLQGAWQNLRDEVLSFHPFEDSDRLLFQIDEAMSWESVNNFPHMGHIVLLIHNIATRSDVPGEIIELIQQVKNDLDCTLEDIAKGKIAIHPTKAKEHKSYFISAPAILPDDERDQYLQHTSIINWQYPAVSECSEKLFSDCTSDLEYARKAFEYVRDKIKHSWDFQDQIVTCSASEVLASKTGYCYAKSHLLAALLRAQKIPTGFCYQRLSREDHGPPYCLHGLNAVFLQQFGWYRVDARGNKKGVNAQFMPPVKKLAFTINEPQERDFSEIWSEPLPIVVQVLQSNTSVTELHKKLPDLQVI